MESICFMVVSTVPQGIARCSILVAEGQALKGAGRSEPHQSEPSLWRHSGTDHTVAAGGLGFIERPVRPRQRLFDPDIVPAAFGDAKADREAEFQIRLIGVKAQSRYS